MSETTYGALLADAERHLVRAIFATREPFQSAPQARHAADDFAQILLALKGGVRTLAGVATPEEQQILPPRQSAASQLFAALEQAVSRFNGSTEARSWRSEWNAAARAISAATSLLASHLGPDRAHRTPDAALLDDGEARQGGLHRLAVFALTTAEGGRPLAFRVQDASIRFGQPGTLRSRAEWLMETQAEIGKAAAAVVLTPRRDASGTPSLSTLRPAPLLVPTRDSDPTAAARESFDHIRLMAHRQARGELAAGIDAIRAYATVGMLAAAHGQAIIAAAGEMHRGDAGDRHEELIMCARAMLDMRKPWASLLNVTEHCASSTHSPALLGREVTYLSGNLGRLTRNANRWQAPAEIVPNKRVEQRLLQLVHHLGSRLPDVAAAARVVTERLHDSGDLLGPTREREDLDVPYRWSPISTERLATFRDAGRAAQATTADAVRAIDVLSHATIWLNRQAKTLSTSTGSNRTPGRSSA